MDLDIKLDNILVNSGKGAIRFSDVKLILHMPRMETGIFRSPEAMLNMTWGVATDIWSLGATASTVTTFCAN